MAKNLSVLFVASEIYPFAKTGGLADVAYGLPLALRDLGHDVRVMLPKYGPISERKNHIHEINRLKDIPIPIGNESEPATVKSSSINNPRTKVQAYVTTNYRYFDSKWGLYADPETGVPYPDNADRFIFFCRTVLTTSLMLGWFPDIVHVNDWHSALVPIFMRKLYPDKFKNTKVVFSIHSIANQGNFPFKETFAKTNLPSDLAADLKHKSEFNFMKAGILYSDHITTVSPTFGKEILSDSKTTNGLSALLKERANKFTPILNGIEKSVWNPVTDKLIPKRYDADDLEKKEINKEELLAKFGLPFKETTPVIGMIGKISEQKGFTLVKEALNSILQEDVQLVILGEGDAELQEFFLNEAKKHPSKIGVKIGFDESLAHLIEAGSDMFLMPSFFEACGLNQLYSLAYGSVPIVRATGGLIDTVFDFDANKGTGNGFVFKDFKPEAMLTAIQRAIAEYQNKEKWNKLVATIMAEDHSWAKSAKKYDEIYRSLFA